MIETDAGSVERIDCQFRETHDWNSRRLWSLWDMIRQPIWKFVTTGILMQNVQVVFSKVGPGRIGGGLAPPPDNLYEIAQKNIQRFIDDLIMMCETLDLPTSLYLLHAAKQIPPKTAGEFNWLIMSLEAEMKSKLFVYIPSERAIFFEKEDILSDSTKEVFPHAYKELYEAANCYAAERYTACVFHSMRAIEIGLRSLGTALGVAFPDKPIELAEWQNIIEQIESKIKLKLTEHVSSKEQATERDSNRKFYSEVAAQFRYFKDGWRIRVAHGREMYVGSQAITVLSHAREFFEDLGKRLSETTS
jgi:hypothetical protein